jgi:hypothetical protein
VALWAGVEVGIESITSSVAGAILHSSRLLLAEVSRGPTRFANKAPRSNNSLTSLWRSPTLQTGGVAVRVSMAFEALSNIAEFQFKNVPPAWVPVVFTFDPDLPLFPLLYFHVLPSGLTSRPSAQDRAFGYVRSVRIDIDSRVLTAEVICNKRLDDSAQGQRFRSAVELEIGHRLGVIDPVTLNDVNNLFAAQSKFQGCIPVLREMWHRVVDFGYGGSLPFGRLWDRVLGLPRYYASYRPPGGRKSELIQTHYFCTHFGEPVASSANVPTVEFRLLPTWEELTDFANPLTLFPKFQDLVVASTDMCHLPAFQAFEVSNWSYTGMKKSKGRPDTKFYRQTLVAGVADRHRTALGECFNAFDKGPDRTIMFLMFLNDVRQINLGTASPSGSSKPRLNPAVLSATDAAEIALTLNYRQSKKVVTIYAQQAHGNPHSLPIDTWIAAFLAYPLNVANYHSKQGSYAGDKANLAAITEFVSSATMLGKVERLLWITAQARKIHSAICDDALWCIKESAGFKARGANPLACKACLLAIRQVCPAYAQIADLEVRFNAKGGDFQLKTTAGDNKTTGQRFTTCTSANGVVDEDTVNDLAGAFRFTYPHPSHKAGKPMRVRDFVAMY